MLFRGYRIAAGYAAAAILLLMIHWSRQRRSGFADINVDMHGGPVTADAPAREGSQP